MKKIIFAFALFLATMTSCMSDREVVYREPYSDVYITVHTYPSYYGCYPYHYDFWYYGNWNTPYYWNWYGYYGYSWHYRPYYWGWTRRPHHHHHMHKPYHYHNFGHNYGYYHNNHVQPAPSQPAPRATVRRNSGTNGSMSGTRPTYNDGQRNRPRNTRQDSQGYNRNVPRNTQSVPRNNPTYNRGNSGAGRTGNINSGRTPSQSRTTTPVRTPSQSRSHSSGRGGSNGKR